jgi:hypothetical protein
MIDDNVTLPSRRRIELMRLSATAVTAGCVLLAYLVARYVGGVHLHSPGFSTMQDPAEVPAGFAVAIALVAALASWGLVEALERRTAHPRRTWLIIAPVVLLVSLGGPLSGHGVSAGDRLALVCLHLTVAAVLIPALGRTLATHRRTRPAEPSPPTTASTEKAAR